MNAENVVNIAGDAALVAEITSQKSIDEAAKVCQEKISLAQKTLEDKDKRPEERKNLVESMIGYFYLADMTKARNIRAVIDMPYFNYLCPSFEYRDISERTGCYCSWFGIRGSELGAVTDTVVSLLLPMSTLIEGSVFVPREPMRFNGDAARENVKKMGRLAVVYQCAKDNPETCVLPDLTGVDTFAAPKDTPMRKDGAPNPDFFTEWHSTVLKKFSVED